LVGKAKIIYHLAAAVGVDLVVRSPILCSRQIARAEVLVEAASTKKVPVLLSSTSEVYGKANDNRFSEEDDLLIGPPHQNPVGLRLLELMDESRAGVCQGAASASNHCRLLQHGGAAANRAL